jgi:CobQ-like glutamine amidotransferase family enzyme
LPANPTGLTVVKIYPEVLGTYGDGGNGLVLAARARARGHDVNLTSVGIADAVPDDGDIYLIGGGEDAAQVAAAAALQRSGALPRALDRGAVVFGVCAGYQILGRTFPGIAGATAGGLGLLDITTRKGPPGRRAVGEIVATSSLPEIPALTGFENHGGRTTLEAGTTALGTVVSGIGNGAGDGTEGAISGRVVGTYLHGPALVRNPALADLLLTWVLGPLAPLDDPLTDRLREQRLAAQAGQRRFRPRRSR